MNSGLYIDIDYNKGQKAFAEKKYTLAFDIWLKDAKNGHSLSQVMLGKLYESGIGIKQDYSLAKQWFEKAADQENAEAQFQLGLLYRNGRGVEQDLSTAFEMYQQAADNSHSMAKNYLGEMYEDGIGVKKNNHKAKLWFTQAAMLGNADAQFNLGQLIFFSSNTENEKNDKESAKWMQAAAQQGHVNALIHMWKITIMGKGVEENAEKAQEWIQKAVDQCDATAQYELGLAYRRNNSPVQKDYDRAFGLFKKSAEQGFIDSFYELAVMYERGEGTKKDPERANFWFSQAANNGIEAARDKIKNQIQLVNSSTIQGRVRLKEADILDSIREEAGLKIDELKILYVGKDVLLHDAPQYHYLIFWVSGERSFQAVQNFKNTVIIDIDGYVYSIYLYQTDIKNTNSIAKLKHLHSVRINNAHPSKTVLTNIDSIWTLPEIEEINVFRNGITEVAPKNIISSLKLLNIGENKISDLTALNKLPSLRYLNIDTNEKIDSLKPIASLVNIEELSANHLALTSLDGIQKLTRLKVLRIVGNGDDTLESLKGIEKLVNLESISAIYQPIKTLEPLSKLKKLERISFRGAKFDTISVFSKLENLKYFSISKTPIKNLIPLKALSKLEEISIDHSNIESLEGLEDLKGLKKLAINRAKLKNLKGINNLTQLKILDLEKNPLKNIQGVEHLKNLTKLNLEFTDIISIDETKELTKLEEINTKHTFFSSNNTVH